MVDVVLCAAELSLIASIATFAHASAIILETFIPHVHTYFILICSFIFFYLNVRQWPGLDNPSFKFLYWKYFLISLLAVDRDYREDPGRYGFDLSMGFWSFFLLEILLFYLIRVDLRSGNIREPEHEAQRVFEPQQELVREPLPSVLYELNTTLFQFDNGFGMTGLGFISIRYGVMVNVLKGVLNVVMGIFLLRLLNKLYLEYGLMLISFVLQQGMSFGRDSIPCAFGVAWYFICYYIVGYIGIGGEYRVTGTNVLEMCFEGLMMYYAAAIFFYMYLFLLLCKFLVKK